MGAKASSGEQARRGCWDIRSRQFPSHTGVIRVFPAVPKDFEGGFENLGAQGAFVVSAEREKTGVQSITLESLAGNDCTLAKPDAAGPWRVRDTTEAKDVAVDADDRTLRFATLAGHMYRVRRGP